MKKILLWLGVLLALIGMCYAGNSIGKVQSSGNIVSDFNFTGQVDLLVYNKTGKPIYLSPPGASTNKEVTAEGTHFKFDGKNCSSSYSRGRNYVSFVVVMSDKLKPNGTLKDPSLFGSLNSTDSFWSKKRGSFTQLPGRTLKLDTSDYNVTCFLRDALNLVLTIKNPRVLPRKNL